MPDFGDETGNSLLNSITRSMKMPFDEAMRILMRKLLNGSQNFDKEFNDAGKVDSYRLNFDSLEERALAMDVMKQEGIKFEKTTPQVTVQHGLKIDPADLDRYRQAMEQRISDIAKGEYSPTHDKTLENVRNQPADKDYMDFAKDMGKEEAIPSNELAKIGDEPTVGEINDAVSANQSKIKKILNMREHGATAAERKEADRALDRMLGKEGSTKEQVGLEEPFNPQAYKSHDGMDPDGRTRQVEGLWKDNMREAVNGIPEGLTLGQFADALAERGYDLQGFSKDGQDLLIAEAGAENHRIRLSNLESKHKIADFQNDYLKRVSKEKRHEAQDRAEAAQRSRELDLGELGDKQLPSQQIVTR